jgi:hypothetical protein
MDDSRIKDVSSLLSSFFEKEKLERGLRYSDFFSSWPGFVGPRLAAHSRVADIEKGLLIVEAEHPGWIQLLQLRQSEILEGVSRRFPELKLRGIGFRLYGKAKGLGEEGVSAAATDRAVEPDAEAEPERPDLSTEPLSGPTTMGESEANPEVKALFSGLRQAILGEDEPH